MIQMCDAQPRMTAHEIAEDFNCDHKTIINILHAAGAPFSNCFFLYLHYLDKQWVKTRWMPFLLTDAQKEKRVRCAMQLVELQREVSFLDWVITQDEKWISYRNPHNGHQWLSKGQIPDAQPRRDFRLPKIMLSVFWNARGVVHAEFVPEDQTVDSDLFCMMLDRVTEKVPAHRRLLLFDNASSHTAKATKAKLQELGWVTLPHPPYSPDLAPSDYHLFRSMAHFLRGKTFHTRHQAMQETLRFLREKAPEFYARGMSLLMDRWQDVILSNGVYINE